MTINKIVSSLLILACLGLAGCNTVHGAGEDISKAGEAIQRTANR